MKPGKLKALGTVFLLLAVVGMFSSWSVTGDDRLASTGTNVLLFVVGAVALFIGYWRSRIRGNGTAQERID
jgi:hypothetical protein